MKIITGHRRFEPAGEEERLGLELLRRLITDAASSNVSDIHIEPCQNEMVIRYRIDGLLSEISRHSPAMGSSLIKTAVKVGAFEGGEGNPEKGRIAGRVDDEGGNDKKIDLLLSTFPTIHGDRMTIRVLDNSRIMDILDGDFEKINLVESQKNDIINILNRPFGMVIISGPTGSGKTTTLCQSMAYLSKETKGKANLISLESPPEVIIDGINQAYVDASKEFEYLNTLRSAMRQDPDILFISEIPDLETLKLTSEIAMTGHLTIVQTSAADSAGALYQFLNMGIEPYFFSMILEGVTSQRLARKICPHCREKAVIPRRLMESVMETMETSQQEMQFYQGKGCEKCSNSGYLGRTAIYEIVPRSDILCDTVARCGDIHALREAIKKSGNRTLRESGLKLAIDGLITLEEALRATTVSLPTKK